MLRRALSIRRAPFAIEEPYNARRRYIACSCDAGVASLPAAPIAACHFADLLNKNQSTQASQLHASPSTATRCDDTKRLPAPQHEASLPRQRSNHITIHDRIDARSATRAAR